MSEILSTLANALSAPRRALWGGVSNLLGTDTPESGTELMGRFGLDTDNPLVKALGLGAEVLTDPLTYALPLGAGLGAKAVKGLGAARAAGAATSGYEGAGGAVSRFMAGESGAMDLDKIASFIGKDRAQGLVNFGEQMTPGAKEFLHHPEFKDWYRDLSHDERMALHYQAMAPEHQGTEALQSAVAKAYTPQEMLLNTGNFRDQLGFYKPSDLLGKEYTYRDPEEYALKAGLLRPKAADINPQGLRTEADIVVPKGSDLANLHLTRDHYSKGEFLFPQDARFRVLGHQPLPDAQSNWLLEYLGVDPESTYMGVSGDPAKKQLNSLYDMIPELFHPDFVKGGNYQQVMESQIVPKIQQLLPDMAKELGTPNVQEAVSRLTSGHELESVRDAIRMNPMLHQPVRQRFDQYLDRNKANRLFNAIFRTPGSDNVPLG